MYTSQSMTLTLLFLLFRLSYVFMYTHQKALQEKLYSERCTRNSVVLNDCNWCWCDQNQRYQCKARVCEEVDMFGHFKDAIKDINVGMEGHGSWRSRPTSCSPGVHYRRGGVLCICDEDGNWPNPVCRDLFRVLHSVELMEIKKISNNDSCTPNKLYLVGCNVCFCPFTSILDSNMCTKRNCDDGDPVLESIDENTLPKDTSKVNDLEVYATCNLKSSYKIGSINCSCIGNNRLLCDDLTSKSKSNILKKGYYKRRNKSSCTGKKPGHKFKVGCNLCHCDENSSIICTSRYCHFHIKGNNDTNFPSERDLNIEHKLKKVKAPTDDESCIPATRYQRDCNTCFCVKMNNNLKYVSCTLKKCKNTQRNPIEDQKEDCVLKSYYTLDCKFCYCYKKNGIKRQACQIGPGCITHPMGDEMTLNDIQLKSVDELHGYCEPLNRYRKNCNICRCLSDGKTLKCESKICVKRSSEHLTVDVVPVMMRNNEICPKGHSYKLDCNLCFCLTNGNAICTTNDCSGP